MIQIEIYVQITNSNQRKLGSPEGSMTKICPIGWDVKTDTLINGNICICQAHTICVGRQMNE